MRSEEVPQSVWLTSKYLKTFEHSRKTFVIFVFGIVPFNFVRVYEYYPYKHRVLKTRRTNTIFCANNYDLCGKFANHSTEIRLALLDQHALAIWLVKHHTHITYHIAHIAWQYQIKQSFADEISPQ